jgi:DNA-directed RNA polymerase subunit RPC12/RpoP
MRKLAKKLPKCPLSRAERERRIKNLIELGYLLTASGVPEEAIPADTAVPAKSWYSLPMPFYSDEVYRCRDCGREVVWTALEKYDYYEVRKGNMYARRVRCDECHEKRT